MGSKTYDKRLILSGGYELMKSFYIMICSLLVYSCGLDTVIYLESPNIRHNNYDSNDDSNKYLEFETSESENESMLDYVKGFEVYYRIYERKEDRASDYSAIYSYNEDNPSASATYLVETKKYKRLAVSGASSNDRPLIKKANTNRKVKIRLSEYGSEAIGFYIDGAKVGVPRRQDSKEFKKDDISNTAEDVFPVPSSNKSDVPDDYWYVNMYAATYGADKSFKPLYSKLEFIGFLKISKQ